MPAIQDAEKEILLEMKALGEVRPNLIEGRPPLGSPSDNGKSKRLAQDLDLFQGEEHRWFTGINGGRGMHRERKHR